MSLKQDITGNWLSCSWGSDKPSTYKHSAIINIYSDNTYTGATFLYGYSLSSGYWKRLEEGNEFLMAAVYQFSRKNSAADKSDCLGSRQSHDIQELVLGVGKLRLDGDVLAGDFKAIKMPFSENKECTAVENLWEALCEEDSRKYPDPDGYKDKTGGHWLVGGKFRAQRILDKGRFLADPGDILKKFADIPEKPKVPEE